jgi:DNA-directed RNA polymerase subunit N (RpoN/RPB10)
MSAENTDDSGPREMPENPARVDWIRCFGCGDRVRPILLPNPDAEISDTEKYNEAVPCQFTCPSCGESMAKEMRAFDQQMYGATHTSYRRFDVDRSWFDD